MRRGLIVLCASAGWVLLLAGAASADTCSIKERDPQHCENTAWVPGVFVAGGGTATAVTVIRKIPGHSGGTTTLIETTPDGRRVWKRPKFKPQRKTAKGTLDPWDPPIDRQRDKWNKDGEVWDPETRSWRPPRPDELEELPPWESPVTKSMPRDQVPESCRGLYDAYAAKQDEQHWLDITRAELEQRLERAIRLLFNNQVKAGIQISGDLAAAGSTVGSGVATGLKGATGAAGGVGRALGAGVDLQNLNDLLSRRNALMKSVDDLPDVRNSRQFKEYWTNKTATAELDLPKADIARKRLGELETVKENMSRRMSKAQQARTPHQHTLTRGPSDIEGLEEQLARNLTDPKAELAHVQKKIRQVEGTAGPSGRPRRPTEQYRLDELERLEERQYQLTRQIDDITRDAQGKIKDVRDRMKAAQQALDDHDKAGYAQLAKDAEAANVEARNLVTQLHQLEDVSAADLARYRRLRDQAAYDAAAAEQLARLKIQPQLDTINAQINDIRDKLVKLNTPEDPSLPVKAIQSLLGPLIAGWEKLFGSGNTPKEMVEILLMNKQAVLLAEQDLVRLKAEQDALSAALQRAKQALDACIAANKAAAPAG
jgi:hypothetical protein